MFPIAEAEPRHVGGRFIIHYLLDVCGQSFWIMNYRQSAYGIQIHHNEQNIAVSKNNAGGKWETTNPIGVALVWGAMHWPLAAI